MQQTIIENGILKATINHFGAELFALEKNGQNYIWEIDGNFWNKTSPILFPIVGGLKNNEYEYDGEMFSLPRHGFAREKNFQVVAKTGNSVTFSLQYDDETLKIYPFKFELQIIYTLRDSELFVQYLVKNLDSEKLYFSIGAHPAFKIVGDFENYSLEFDRPETLIFYQLHDNLFSGKTREIQLNSTQLPLDYQLFENDAIVLKNYTTTSLKLFNQNQPILNVKFSEFPYLGIWTKKDAPFICIEPWLGIADNHNASGKIEEKEGIQTLEALSQQSFEWSIELF